MSIYFVNCPCWLKIPFSNNFLSRSKAIHVASKNIFTMILIKLISFQTLLKQIRKRLKKMEWLLISVHIYSQLLTSLLADDRFDWSRQTIGDWRGARRIQICVPTC